MLESVFNFLDMDGDGSITNKDLKKYFSNAVDKQVSDLVWDEMVKEVDFDGDGKVDFKEFQKAMLELS